MLEILRRLAKVGPRAVWEAYQDKKHFPAIQFGDTKMSQMLVSGKFRDEINTILGHSNWRMDREGGFPAGHYTLHLTDTQKSRVAHFEIAAFPGCCGIAISTGAWVGEDFRGKGIGKILAKLRVELARTAGYGMILCTDVESNVPQRRLLAANGWTDIAGFNNPKTGNNVFITAVVLNERREGAPWTQAIGRNITAALPETAGGGNA